MQTHIDDEDTLKGSMPGRQAPPHSFLPPSPYGVFRISSAAVLLGSLCVLVIGTWRWPLIWDAQVFHYINFLISKGWQPYRGITDMNMPGAYLADSLVLHTLGGGDLAWRIYDFALLAITTASCVAIAMPYDWVAGLFAGVQFCLFHSLDGPYNTGQRDEFLIAMVLLAYAFLFRAVRKASPGLAFPFGLCIGMASTVKPTAIPLGIVVLALACLHQQRSRKPFRRIVLFSVAGAVLPLAGVLIYLLHHRALGAFLEISRRITPFYSSLNNVPLRMLLREAAPKSLLLLCGIALIATVANVRNKDAQPSGGNWERWAILFGVGFGAFSYLVQRKGYVYHRYPFFAFALLWFAIESVVLYRSHARLSRVGVAALGMGTFVFVPICTRRVLLINGNQQNQFAPALVRDISALGGAKLQRKVQCLDLVDGCLKALYMQRIVQSTGTTGDLVLFAPRQSPVVTYYRQAFWQEMMQHQPDLIVLSNEWYSEPNTFDKVGQWPQLATLLATHYHLLVRRQFTDDQRSAYELFWRDDIPVPASFHPAAAPRPNPAQQ